MENFEEELMTVHRNITLSCLQYVQGKADKIFIYFITERSLTTFDVFFKIGTNYCYAHKVNDFLASDQAIDTSNKAQNKMLDEVFEDLEAFREIHEHYNRERPTESRLVYDVNDGNLQWEYSYEKRYERDKNLIPSEEMEKWFEEVRSKNV